MNDVVNVEISVDKDGNVDPKSIEYNDYRSDLNSIYKATADNNSVISTYTVSENTCNHKLVIKYVNGTVSIEKNNTFDFSENFKEDFLVNMLNDYCIYNKVVSDNVIIKENGKVIFKVNTSDNDLLVIDDIDMDFASKLSDLVYKKDESNQNLIDSKEIRHEFMERGNSSTVTIILTIVLAGIVLLGTIFFSIMVYK